MSQRTGSNAQCPINNTAPADIALRTHMPAQPISPGTSQSTTRTARTAALAREGTAQDGSVDTFRSLVGEAAPPYEGNESPVPGYTTLPSNPDLSIVTNVHAITESNVCAETRPSEPPAAEKSSLSWMQNLKYWCWALCWLSFLVLTSAAWAYSWVALYNTGVGGDKEKPPVYGNENSRTAIILWLAAMGVATTPVVDSLWNEYKFLQAEWATKGIQQRQVNSSPV